MTIKLIENAGSLSEDDLKLLVGTEVIQTMMRNRIMLVLDAKEIDWALLTSSLEGLYHIRELNRNRLYQLWFEYTYDMDQFKKNLYMLKLSLDDSVTV